MAEEPPRLLAPVTLQGTPTALFFFDSAAFSDGSIAVAYADDTSTLSSLRAVVFNGEGAPLQAPFALDSSAGSITSLAVASASDDTAAVVWVGGGRIGFATLSRVGLGVVAFVPSPGLSPSECKVAADSMLFALACSMVDTSSSSAVKETYLYMIDHQGVSALGPSLVSPGDDIVSSVAAVTCDGSGIVWIAYREPDPLGSPGYTTSLASVDAAGKPISGPRLLASAPTAAAPVGLAPLSGSLGGIIAGLARSSAANGNAEIVLKTFGANGTAPQSEILLTSSASAPQALSIVQTPIVSSERYLVEWMERRPADQLVSGPNLLRPVIAIADRTLSLSVAPMSLATLVPESMAFLYGSGDFVSADGTLLLYRFAFSAPPTTGATEPAPSPAPTIIVAVIIGSMVPLVLVEERLRWGLIAIFLPFYARLRGEKIMLDNMRRGAIVQLVKDNPGIRFRELSRRTGIAQGALEHHLRVLQYHGFISKESVGREVRFYLDGKNPIAEEPFSELRERIMSEIHAHPGVAHSALAKSLGVEWATLLYHLEMLHADGQVRYRSRRGRRRYWLQEPEEN